MKKHRIVAVGLGLAAGVFGAVAYSNARERANMPALSINSGVQQPGGPNGSSGSGSFSLGNPPSIGGAPDGSAPTLNGLANAAAGANGAVGANGTAGQSGPIGQIGQTGQTGPNGQPMVNLGIQREGGHEGGEHNGDGRENGGRNYDEE